MQSSVKYLKYSGRRLSDLRRPSNYNLKIWDPDEHGKAAIHAIWPIGHERLPFSYSVLDPDSRIPLATD